MTTPIERRGVVAVVLRERALLVIRRSQHVVAPGAYCFPGGGIEPGEDEATALRREMREELNVAAEPLERIWQSITPWRVSLGWWLTTLDEHATLAPNPAEVESVHWYEPHEIAALSELLSSNHEFLAALASGTIRLPWGDARSGG